MVNENILFPIEIKVYMIFDLFRIFGTTSADKSDKEY